MNTQMELDHHLIQLSKAQGQVFWLGPYNQVHPPHLYFDPIHGLFDWIQGLPRGASQSLIESS